jgi:hypothetical protein
MAKLSRRQRKKEQKKQDQETDPTSPWLAMRTGLTIVTILSIGMAIFVAWTVIPATSTVEGILWGLGFGAGIWFVFVLAFAFNRFVRGKRG